MVPSIPDYIDYANNVLAPKLDPEVLKKLENMSQLKIIQTQNIYHY